MKNKIFLGLILGIFLIGIVSASITGYLTARDGGEIREAGYTATLQKVEGTTAIVSVQTPTGDTELVRVAEGKTAKVGDVEISASNLTRGTLFRRGGGNIGLNISNISGATQIKVPGASGGTGAVTGHTHLSDYQIVAESLVETGSGLIEGQASCKVAFGSDYVVLGGGFKLTDALETGMIINGPFSDEAWRVELNANTSSNPGLPMYGKVYAICARIEPTLHQFGQDY